MSNIEKVRKAIFTGMDAADYGLIGQKAFPDALYFDFLDVPDTVIKIDASDDQVAVIEIQRPDHVEPYEIRRTSVQYEHLSHKFPEMMDQIREFFRDSAIKQ